jgi:hypothetical protein
MEARTDVNVFPVFSQLHRHLGLAETTAVPNVASFPQSLPAREITQLEIELLLSLRNRLAQLESQVATEEDAFLARLEAGASIEPGVHVAELKEHFRRNVSWKDVVVRLANRLRLNGEAYCAKVLAATKPTRTVSLDVR